MRRHVPHQVWCTDNLISVVYAGHKVLNKCGDCADLLGCAEVRVEPRVLFRLELPSGKSIGVKAKPAKVIRDVLGPILLQVRETKCEQSPHNNCEFSCHLPLACVLKVRLGTIHK